MTTRMCGLGQIIRAVETLADSSGLGPAWCLYNRVWGSFDGSNAQTLVELEDPEAFVPNSDCWPHPKGFWWNLMFCISIKFPGDAVAAVLGTTVETPVYKLGLYQQGQAHLHSNMCQHHLPSVGGSPCLQISTYWSQIKKPHHKSKIRKPSTQHFSTNWMPTYFC